MDTLRPLSLWVLAGLVVAGFFVARFFQRLVFRLVAVGLCVVLAAGVWLFRQDLNECWERCDCHLLGRDLTIPDDLQARARALNPDVRCER